MTEKDMAKVFSEKKYSLVIDSTHPYADIVTANIKAACDETEVEYIRLLRAEEPVPKGVTLVENIEEAARALDKMEGKFLLTTGAKELFLRGQSQGYCQVTCPLTTARKPVCSQSI